MLLSLLVPRYFALVTTDRGLRWACWTYCFHDIVLSRLPLVTSNYAPEFTFRMTCHARDHTLVPSNDAGDLPPYDILLFSGPHLISQILLRFAERTRASKDPSQSLQTAGSIKANTIAVAGAKEQILKPTATVSC